MPLTTLLILSCCLVILTNNRTWSLKNSNAYQVRMTTAYLVSGIEGRLKCQANLQATIKSLENDYLYSSSNRKTSSLVPKFHAKKYPKQVHWSMQSKSLNGKKHKIMKDGDLVIKNVSYNDQDLYRCQYIRASADKQEEFTLEINVIVRDPIYFSAFPRPLYQRHANQSVSLPCVPQGFTTTPTAVWKKVVFSQPQNFLKVGGELPARFRSIYEGNNLTLVTLNKEDQGTYECIASDGITKSVCQTLLIIEATPQRPPYNLTVTTKQTTATICWLPAYDHGHPQHYVIWYREFKSKHLETNDIWNKNTKASKRKKRNNFNNWDSTIENEIWDDYDEDWEEVNDLNHPKTSTENTSDQRDYLSEKRIKSNESERIKHNNISENGSKKSHKQDWMTIKVVDTDPQTHCITLFELRSSTPYQFMLLARNKLGDAFFSKTIIAATKDNYSFRDDEDTNESGFEDFDLTLSREQRPSHPENISVIQTKEGLYISWLPSASANTHYYNVHYKTRGRWLLLNDKPIKETYTLWTTHLVGVTYYFRVTAHLESNISSSPSPVASIETGNSLAFQTNTATKLMVAFFTILLLLVIFVFLIITLIKSCCYRHQRGRLIRYDNVKYFGPSQCEPQKSKNLKVDHDKQQKVTTVEQLSTAHNINKPNISNINVKNKTKNSLNFIKNVNESPSSYQNNNVHQRHTMDVKTLLNRNRPLTNENFASLTNLSHLDRKLILETPI